MIKFISYSGKYPNLCRGELILEVNGKIYKFGKTFINPNNYKSFWSSGGSIGFAGPGYTNPCVDIGEWIIYGDSLPKELQPYRDEIAKVFNANVPYGCCGGCL